MSDLEYKGMPFSKLHKEFDRLSRYLFRLQEMINPLIEKNKRLYKENQDIRKLLKAREQWDKQNLPDDKQKFIEEFINKYDVKDETPNQS